MSSAIWHDSCFSIFKGKKMKTAITLFLSLLFYCSAFAAEINDVKEIEESPSFRLDLGVSVNVPVRETIGSLVLFKDIDWSEISLSVRGGPFIDFTDRLHRAVRAGVKLGFYLGGYENVTIVDFPLRTILRFTSKSFFLQPHFGICFHSFSGSLFNLEPPSTLPHFDVGGKIGFGEKARFFTEIQYLFGHELFGVSSCPRIGCGIMVNLFGVDG
jgi:hypothetical protein